MSDRWAFDDNGKLRERVAIIETTVSSMRLEMDRRFNQLAEGQASHRAYTETELTSIKVLLRGTMPQTLDASLYRITIAIGFAVAVLIIILLMLWVRLGTIGIHL